MKTLFNSIVVTLLVLIPVSAIQAFDDPNAPIVEAFMESEDVYEALSELQINDQFLEQDEISVTAISGACGVKGCDHSYLVVLKMAYKGTNPYYTNISGIVKVSAIGKGKAEFAELVDFE